MKEILSIFLLIIFCVGSAIAQEEESYIPPKFIHHDPIPLTLVDSVYNFYGKKIAATTYQHALTPAYPIQQITRYASDPEVRELWQAGKLNCFKMGGGLIQSCIYYQALINGDTVLIDSHEKFREVFAPVDNIQEAIAFAYFFTESEPIYNIDFLKPEDKYKSTISYIIDPDSGAIIDSLELKHRIARSEWSTYLPVISSSYVKKIDDGYELLLYHYKVFGCSHPYTERLIKVYTNGKVEIIKEQRAFEDSRDSGLCID